MWTRADLAYIAHNAEMIHTISLLEARWATRTFVFTCLLLVIIFLHISFRHIEIRRWSMDEDVVLRCFANRIIHSHETVTANSIPRQVRSTESPEMTVNSRIPVVRGHLIRNRAFIDTSPEKGSVATVLCSGSIWIESIIQCLATIHCGLNMWVTIHIDCGGFAGAKGRCNQQSSLWEDVPHDVGPK